MDVCRIGFRILAEPRFAVIYILVFRRNAEADQILATVMFGDSAKFQSLGD